MSWLGSAALYAVKELARPALEEVGKKVGAAAGSRLGRKIDPKVVIESEPDRVAEDERTP